MEEEPGRTEERPSEEGPSEDGRIAALASLNEPVRRRLYRHVAAQDAPVSREEAARAVEVPRSVAAFHLDKLAELGLLEVEYRRPPGRRGPGAGRPTKRYRRAAGEIALSVPERHYDLAAELLARAVERASATSTDVVEVLGQEARAHGRRLWEEAANPADGPPSVAALVAVLAAHGYEPRVSGGCVTLANCPFHALAEEHRPLVCAMNHELLRGLAEAAGLPASSARLDPAPGRCCVTLVA